ncbi:MAG: hypothetical protein ACE5FF_01815 [Saprospiraceae bacterium]
MPVKETSITGNSEFRDHEGAFGLKQAFDPDPGWFNVYAEIAFPSTGVYAQDSNYLMSVWKNIDISVFYKDFKK